MKCPPVYRITLVQGAVLAPLSLFCWLTVGQLQAVSLFAGGLVAILPQAWFAARVFRWRGAQATAAIARSALAGEVGKFTLSMVGFAAIFALLRPVDGAAVLGGYIAMVAIQITGSWLLLRQRPADRD
ncbi:ATP synthase subunit I [Kineobactrum salinum]|uniref:F0F1 ATP synthase subunit I n=1 Tax=Kineobactrum salinum TaxID=2708301 RepID=A0A6C0U124_9GAMM|nr:ATP synthase subunit I [Kineobactrum salinum]QIB65598.1 F0F1 ATP synthase subunit I [Kineobactrum salinum]